MTTEATESLTTQTSASLVRELLGGMIAAAIALGCVLPPLLHFVTAPLGPFIGAFIVANHLKPDHRGRAVIAGALGVSLTGLFGAVAYAIASMSGPKGPPDWFPDPGDLGIILGGIFLYATALGAVGAAFGARRGQKPSE